MKYTNSVKKKGTFKYVINKGKFSKGKYLIVYVSKSQKTTNSLGICVSKKNGISVHRNKFKRWVRESYKEQECRLNRGLTIIVMYKKYVNLEMVDYHKINKDIVKSFNELGLYEKN